MLDFANMPVRNWSDPKIAAFHGARVLHAWYLPRERYPQATPFHSIEGIARLGDFTRRFKKAPESSFTDFEKLASVPKRKRMKVEQWCHMIHVAFNKKMRREVVQAIFNPALTAWAERNIRALGSAG